MKIIHACQINQIRKSEIIYVPLHLVAQVGFDI